MWRTQNYVSARMPSVRTSAKLLQLLAQRKQLVTQKQTGYPIHLKSVTDRNLYFRDQRGKRNRFERRPGRGGERHCAPVASQVTLAQGGAKWQIRPQVSV